MRNLRISTLIITVLVVLVILPKSGASASELSEAGLHVIPYPQEVNMGGGSFAVTSGVSIILDPNAPAEDRFAAGQLIRSLREEYGIEAAITSQKVPGAIILTRKGAEKKGW